MACRRHIDRQIDTIPVEPLAVNHRGMHIRWSAGVDNADGEIAANWDYLDRRRVVVQRSAVTRERPALLAGWSATITFAVFTPVYITPDLLHDVLIDAGRLVGVGDFRPTFGRFQITKFDVGMLD